MITRTELEDAILDAERRGVEPEIHPNGFIQLDISHGADRTRRLHLWDPELPKQEVRTAIHDHIFDLVSEVIVGELFHCKYDVFLDDEGPYEVHQALTTQCTETNLVPNGQRALIIPHPTEPLAAGSTYTFPAFSFHESWSEVPTFTVMTKTVFHLGTAKVLVPVGAQPDNSFSRTEHDVSDMWQRIYALLKEVPTEEVAV